MNIDRYWTQVEDANQYYHIYRSKYWHPAWIHSKYSIKCKRENAPHLKPQPGYSAARDQLSELLLCSHFRGKRRRRMSASLGLLAYGDCVQPWITLYGIQKSFLCSAEGKGVHVPASSISWRAKENLLLFKVSKSSIRKLFHVMCGHCMSFPIIWVTVRYITYNVTKKQFSTWYQTRLKKGMASFTIVY